MKFFLALALSAAALFAQTPCIDQAKAGIVGVCLDSKAPVTSKDAAFVGTVPGVAGYLVDPVLPTAISYEFVTKEQALAIIELIKFANPGSQLTLKDTGETSFSFPPFRELRYFNDGGLTAPRIYTVVGTIKMGDVDLQTVFEPGWFLNVTRLLYKGSYDTQELGYPFGNTKLVVVAQMGGAFPKWVGK